MATVTWKKGVSGSWTTGSNWVGGTPPGPSDTASFPADSGSPYTVTLDASESLAAMTIGAGVTLDIASGNTLTTTSTITVNTGGVLEGVGVVNAGGGFLGGGTIEAGPGGTLTVYGVLPSTMHLAVGTGGDLVIGTANTVSASKLSLSGADETLTVDNTTLVISGRESLSGANIVLDGGALTDVSGIYLGGGTITGHGTVTTGNGASTDLNGPGTVTASGGALTFVNAVDGGGTAQATTYEIDSGATLAFDAGVGNVAIPLDPTVNFQGTNATLDLTGEGKNEKTEFYGVVTNFVAGDQILVQGSGKAGDTAVYNQTNNTLYILNGGKIIDQIQFSESIVGQPFKVTENGNIDDVTICFFAGTHIRTPEGEVAVETLKPGDLVTTADGRSVAVNWLGKQTISMRFADPLRVLPIRIMAGALAENTPLRDLLVSPDHALWIDGALVHAGALVNGRSIVQETRVPTVFTYYHIETDEHSLILAEGAPAETFVDKVDRLNFDNWAEYQALYPDGKTIEELPYPRAKSHRQVPVRVRVRLAERAEALSLSKAAVA
jgi:hypothetical protein